MYIVRLFTGNFSLQQFRCNFFAGHFLMLKKNPKFTFN